VELKGWLGVWNRRCSWWFL